MRSITLLQHDEAHSVCMITLRKSYYQKSVAHQSNSGESTCQKQLFLKQPVKNLLLYCMSYPVKPFHVYSRKKTIYYSQRPFAVMSSM